MQITIVGKKLSRQETEKNCKGHVG